MASHTSWSTLTPWNCNDNSSMQKSLTIYPICIISWYSRISLKMFFLIYVCIFLPFPSISRIPLKMYFNHVSFSSQEISLPWSKLRDYSVPRFPHSLPPRRRSGLRGLRPPRRATGRPGSRRGDPAIPPWFWAENESTGTQACTSIIYYIYIILSLSRSALGEI